MDRVPLLLFIILGICSSSWAQTADVSLCSLQDHPEKFLGSKVEVEALVFAGVEYPRLTAGKCSFRFARGDDYQTFGEHFPVNQDEQWTLLKRFLSTSECASNVRVAKAKIKGTVIRVPASGNRPQNAMPFEVVIQSVSGVEHVRINCTHPTVPPSNTTVPEAGHTDLPSQH
jgi:hypothetical protein